MEARRLVAMALADQRREDESDSDLPNVPLAQLGELPRDLLETVLGELRVGGADERRLAARVLVASSLPGTAVLPLALELLRSEQDARVVRWIVRALGSTRSAAALPMLTKLAQHQDPVVRFPVPDSLSMCAEGHFDAVAAPMMLLAAGLDSEVRWSAVFELVEWAGVSDDPDLLNRLEQIAADDPSQEIRSLASATTPSVEDG